MIRRCLLGASVTEAALLSIVPNGPELHVHRCTFKDGEPQFIARHNLLIHQQAALLADAVAFLDRELRARITDQSSSAKDRGYGRRSLLPRLLISLSGEDLFFGDQGTYRRVLSATAPPTEAALLTVFK